VSDHQRDADATSDNPQSGLKFQLSGLTPASPERVAPPGQESHHKVTKARRDPKAGLENVSCTEGMLRLPSLVPFVSWWFAFRLLSAIPAPL